MLLAQTEDGRIISLVKVKNKVELEELKKNENFICPVCKEKVILKTGTKRIWHFAHAHNTNCGQEFERESDYHLQGKIKLYEWFQNQGFHVELEKYIPEIKQRPDLFFQWKNKTYAIEYQCSKIDLQLLKKRTAVYLQNHITPIWIAGRTRLKKVSRLSIKLSTFDLSMANFLHHQPLLIYYCPITNLFTILSNLLPFSSTIFTASTDIVPACKINFSQLIQWKQGRNFECGERWLSLKQRFRMNTHLYLSTCYKRFFYENGCPISLLPGEAGIPVKSMIWMQTEAILWQGWILVKFIIPSRRGETISFHTIFHRFKEEVRKGFFVIRQLPFIKDSHYSFAILEYLQKLEKLGVLKRTGSMTLFQKETEIIIPQNVENACQLDRDVWKRLNNLEKYRKDK